MEVWPGWFCSHLLWWQDEHNANVATLKVLIRQDAPSVKTADGSRCVVSSAWNRYVPYPKLALSFTSPALHLFGFPEIRRWSAPFFRPRRHGRIFCYFGLAATSLVLTFLLHPWKRDKSPASQAARSPGALKSQSGRIWLLTLRRSCQRSVTEGRPQNQ